MIHLLRNPEAFERTKNYTSNEQRCPLDGSTHGMYRPNLSLIKLKEIIIFEIGMIIFYLFHSILSPQIIVKRSSAGYGFSVTGTCPVQVCTIEPSKYQIKQLIANLKSHYFPDKTDVSVTFCFTDSSAAAAGLQRGDCIVAINGQNVSRSSSVSVARIVR